MGANPVAKHMILPMKFLYKLIGKVLGDSQIYS